MPLCSRHKHPAEDAAFICIMLLKTSQPQRNGASWYTHNFHCILAYTPLLLPSTQSVALSTNPVARFNIFHKNANNLITTPKECVYFPVLISSARSKVHPYPCRHGRYTSYTLIAQVVCDFAVRLVLMCRCRESEGCVSQQHSLCDVTQVTMQPSPVSR